MKNLNYGPNFPKQNLESKCGVPRFELECVYYGNPITLMTDFDVIQLDNTDGKLIILAHNLPLIAGPDGKWGWTGCEIKAYYEKYPYNEKQGIYPWA